jgi:inorganic pyrophosphatase
MNEQAYTSFLDELSKIAASSERLTVSKSRTGRRPMSVTTMLAKDKAGTLHKKAEAPWHDKLPGGLADKKKPGEFSSTALKQGRKVEREHTKDPSLPTEIAMDHLTEDPKYYDKLRVVEKDSSISKCAFKLQGHMKFQGIPIAIENRKGSTREGVDPDGKPWKTTFDLPYGFIKKTEGKDGEEIDAYIGPQDDASHAFVVHQRKIDGTGHDEDKVFLGMPSVEAVRKAYLKHYNKVGPKLLGEISTLSMDTLKAKLEESRKHTKLTEKAAEVDVENTTLYGDKAVQRLPGKKGDVPGRDDAAANNKLAALGPKKGDVPSRDGNASSAGKVEKQDIGDSPLDVLANTVAR